MLEVCDYTGGRKVGVQFDVISKEFSSDVREIVSDVVNENVEKDWAQDTSLWDTADHRTRFRERRSNSNGLCSVIEESLDPEKKVAFYAISLKFDE